MELAHEIRKCLKSNSTWLIVAICVLTLECVPQKGTSFCLFSYPPDSVPHTVNGVTNWSYIGTVEFHFEGAYGDRSTKNVFVKVSDQNDMVGLEDSFNLFGGDLCAKDIWNNFDTLKILFYDRSEGELPVDEETGKIDTSYSKIILTNTYLFNGTLGLFERQHSN